MLGRYYEFSPKNRARALALDFGTRLAEAPPASLDTIYDRWNDTMGEVLGGTVRDVDYPAEKVATVWAGLRASDAPRALQEAFVDDLLESTRFAYLSKFGSTHTRAVFTAFRDVGRAEHLPDFFEAIRTNQVDRWSSNPEAYAGYAERAVKRSVVELTDDLLTEVQERPRTSSDADMLAYVAQLSELLGFAFERNEYNVSRDVAGHLIEDLQGRDLSAPQHLDAFRNLTQFAVNFETDAYFEAHVLPDIQNRGDVELLRTLLKEGRIKSSQLQVDLASEVLDVAHPDASPETVIDRLDEMVPKSSNAKDTFLEGLAWTHDLSGGRLKTLIEDNKSINWRRHDPQPLTFNGTFTEAIKALKPEKRVQLVSYLINGASEEAILDEIIGGIKTDLDGRFSRAFAIAKYNGLGALTDEAIDEQLEQARTA
ncbi:MAG: hypothetical protein MO852_16425, partial [Candidatus Devosia euplotis]|nr:hypothetical protein [Candidatus Devosia euplotis]